MNMAQAMKSESTRNIDWSVVLEVSGMSRTDIEDAVEIERTTIYSPWSEDMFRLEIDRQNDGLVVFRLEGKLVGYYCFWKILDEAHLLNFSVRQEFRGKGLGTFLMDHLQQVCKRKNISIILLEVAETNYSATKLYGKSGFVRVGTRKRFYRDTGDDAILMEKRL